MTGTATRGTPRERRRAQGRREVLDAAWELAERDGIAVLSLRELASAVGMRAPSLYTYFDGKAAIHDAMYAEAWEQFDEVHAGLDVGPADPRAALVAITRAFLRFCQASLPRYQLMFSRVLPDWEPSAEAYAASERSYGRFVAAMADLGIEDPAHLDLWTAMLSGLAAQQVANDPDGDRWVRLAEDAVDMFLAHVRRTP